MENIGLAVTLLITGFVVVFLILILLIAIIKLYSTIVYKAQTGAQEKKTAKKKAENEQKEKQTVTQPQKPVQTDIADSDAITPELIAVITAAAQTVCGSKNIKIKGIKKPAKSRPVWSTAGLMENTRPF
ncbi:MAG: OadG family transporter subunit [Acutalibacteraceae bacterium]